MYDYKDKIQQLIAQNQLDEAIETLQSNVKKYLFKNKDSSVNELNNILITNLGKLNDLKKEKMFGTLEKSSEKQAKAEVCKAIFYVLDQLPEEFYLHFDIIWENEKFGYFTDLRDGNRYKVVKIGSQIWMAENLRFKVLNGCWAYDDNEENAKKYGYLYDWETACKVAPKGWHLPSDDEWKQLEIALGMSKTEADKEWLRGEGIGAKLKSVSGWKYEGNGTNESGFNALPVGCCKINGSFNEDGYNANVWSSTPRGGEDAWYHSLGCNYSGVGRYDGFRTYGFSVRLIKD